MHPSPDETATALQDRGVRATKKKKGKDVPHHKYPSVERLAGKTHNAIQGKVTEKLDSNVSGGRAKLMADLTITRKHVDVSEVDPFFVPCTKDGKAHLLKNDLKTCGIELSIKHFQEQINQVQRQKNAARTHNDGLRLACVMLDPKCRAEVAGIMTKKKNRAKSDIKGDPNLHVFEKLLDEAFAKDSCVIGLPPSQCHDEFPEE